MTQHTLSLQQRVGISLQPTNPTTLLTTIIEAEQAGVDHVWIAFGPLGYPDTLTTLAAAVARTTHLKLGTSIIQISSRHPVLMAQQLLSLTNLAPKRIRLGIGGTGLSQLAKNTYGVDMTSPLAYLREYIQVLRPLLTHGEVHHQGQYFTVDATLPTTAPTPIYISALGPTAFQLAGEIADGALPFITPVPYLLNTALPALTAGATAAARPRPPLVAHIPVAFTEDRALALQAGRQALGIYPTLPAYRNMFHASGFTPQDTSTLSDHLISNLVLFGHETQITDHIHTLLNTGIDTLALSLIPISPNPTQEHQRLAHLISNL